MTTAIKSLQKAADPGTEANAAQQAEQRAILMLRNTWRRLTRQEATDMQQQARDSQAVPTTAVSTVFDNWRNRIDRYEVGNDVSLIVTLSPTSPRNTTEVILWYWDHVGAINPVHVG